MIHEVVKQYMQKQGIKQTWLADRLKIPESKLSEILNGKRPFYSDIFAKVCLELDVSADDIISQLPKTG